MEAQAAKLINSEAVGSIGELVYATNSNIIWALLINQIIHGLKNVQLLKYLPREPVQVVTKTNNSPTTTTNQKISPNVKKSKGFDFNKKTTNSVEPNKLISHRGSITKAGNIINDQYQHQIHQSTNNESYQVNVQLIVARYFHVMDQINLNSNAQNSQLLNI
ncbi:hypothetical protein ACTFIW_008381 [Dictyostelium discoideum]